MCLCLCREQRSLLLKCAATALSSKLIAHQKDFFSRMVVDAVSLLDDLLPLNMIGVKKVQGGSLEASDIVQFHEMNYCCVVGKVRVFFVLVCTNCVKKILAGLIVTDVGTLILESEKNDDDITL